jgi:hypothetical protein
MCNFVTRICNHIALLPPTTYIANYWLLHYMYLAHLQSRQGYSIIHRTHDGVWNLALRASPLVLSMWLKTGKFIVKKSKCAASAQEIGFSAPNSCSFSWVVKGATHLCTSKKDPCKSLQLYINLDHVSSHFFILLLGFICWSCNHHILYMFWWERYFI